MHFGINAISADTAERFARYIAVAGAPNSPLGLQNLSYFAAGKRLVVVTAVEGLDTVLSAITIDYAWVGYDIEGWEQTPEWERQHPIEACQQGHAIALAHGKRFAVGPSLSISKQHGVGMVVHCERYTPQGKGLQAVNDTVTYRSHLVTLKAAKPITTELWGDVASAPKGVAVTSQQMVTWVRSYADLVTGVSIFAHPAEYDAVAQFLKLIGKLMRK